MTPREKHLTDEHFYRFRAFLSQTETTQMTMLLLLLQTGMRQDEVVRLKWMNFSFGVEPRVFVEAAKDSVSRWLPMDGLLADRVKRLGLADAYFRSGGCLGDLISDARNSASQKKALRRAFHIALQLAIGDHRYSAHSLRHTFALRCLKAMGNDLLKVKLIMGHKSINSTARYLEYLRAEDLHADVLRAIA